MADRIGKRTRRRAMAWGLLALLLAAGCRTVPRAARLTVANATGKRLTAVAVEVGGVSVLRADELRAGAETPPALLAGGAPARLVVRWRGTSGGEVVREAAPGETPPRRFAGTVYVRIRGPGEVRVLLLSPAEPESDLPWNERQSWEGVLPMPGLTP